MSQGAPAVSTNPFYTGYESNPRQDAEAAIFRSQTVKQEIPVYGQAMQYSVPGAMHNRGWHSPDIPTCAGPTYEPLKEAPPVHYMNKSYAGLVQLSAKPIATPNRQKQVLSAPAISTTY